MVKGNSRQVILVNAPDQKLFEQAIFILRDDAQGVTDEALLTEAKKYITPRGRRKKRLVEYGPLWACAGAAVTGLAWTLCGLF